MLIVAGVFTILFCEGNSYPNPPGLDVPLPSGYGTGAGYAVDTSVYGINLEPSGHGNGIRVESSGYGNGLSVEPNNFVHGIRVESDTSNQILTPLANLGDTVNAKINQVVNSKQIQVVTPFPDSGRKSAVLELASRETIPIQADIKYANLQQFAANFYHPKPIIDTIQEHEKYGNDGGKGRAFSTLVVSAFEGLSNALNAAVDIPFQAAKAIGRKITDTLNPVGAKLVGLA